MISPPAIPSVPGRALVANHVPDSQQPRSANHTLTGEQNQFPPTFYTATSAHYGATIPLDSSSGDHRHTEPIGTSYNSAKLERSNEPTNDASHKHPDYGSLNDEGLTPNGHVPRSTLHAFSDLNNHVSSPSSAYTAISPQYPTQSHSKSNGSIDTFIPYQNLSTLTPLPLPSFPSIPNANSRPPQAIYPPVSNLLSPGEMGLEPLNAANADSTMSDSTGYLHSIPANASAGYSLSPSILRDDFVAWLLSNSISLGDPRQGDAMSIGLTAFTDSNSLQVQSNMYAECPQGENPQNIPAYHPMAVESILGSPSPTTVLSEDKRMELLDLIDMRFNEIDHAVVREQKKNILSGDRHNDGHVLSLKMMKLYIGSYWYHFHPQMPILHQPTFSPDKAQNLLLIIVMIIGASCLDKDYGDDVTKAAAELSNFLAWHVRIEIFKSVDFTPPAKLWVFQTLVLLEIYEKMFSTRVLHERAHIHHGTTLTLMRRGTALIVSPAFELPKRDRQARSSDDNQQLTVEQWWNSWITSEATRRVAFAAFIIDSIHATMFGHGATIIAHEMKMPLPCDESAWSATSGAEVDRIETDLRANGAKPINFLDGLRLTLSHKTVQTNPFGRTTLMAGLLNVFWHLNQRDIQIQHVGASLSLEGKDGWRRALIKAVDFWRDDFDQSLGKAVGAPFSALGSGKRHDDNQLEGKTVLHSLAHIAMHMDVVSCQILAKASRLLGRIILSKDYAFAEKRIRELWAPKPGARHATFYALKLLTGVLAPDLLNERSNARSFRMAEIVIYSARNDFLLNRPWALYVAALTVWSYGYALDGPLKSVPNLSTYEQQFTDMRLFLERVGGIKHPSDLEDLPDRNACMGMLMILQSTFLECRWELMREAAALLSNCVEMLQGVR